MSKRSVVTRNSIGGGGTQGQSKRQAGVYTATTTKEIRKHIGKVVNLYFMPIFPICTPPPPTPPTSFGESGVLGGDAYVSDICTLKNLGEFP